MKQTFAKLLLTGMLISVLHTQCGSASKLLSSDSPLMSALATNSNLSGMAALLQTPGLEKVLGGALKGPFTLLAPINNAFQALGGDAISNLTKPENLNSLAGLIKNHIVPGKLMPGELLGSGIKTSSGKALDLAGVTMGNLIGDEKFNIVPIDKVLQ